MDYKLKFCRVLSKVFIVLFLVIVQFRVSEGQNATEVALYNSLFANYKKFLRPIQDGNYFKQIVVSLQFFINQVESLDERGQKLTTHGYLSLQWKDEFLTWNASEHGGGFLLVVPADHVWLPEITPTNSVEGATELRRLDEDTRVRIYNDGTVLWIPSLKWVTTCNVDVRNFPYDTQQCEVHYANWMYTARLVNFTVNPTVGSTTETLDGQEWAIAKTEAWMEQEDDGAGTLIPFVKMRIHLKRDPTFFELNVLVPAMLLSVLMIPMFILPVESGEKVSLGVTMMLAYSIFLLMMTDVTPRSGTTPQLTMVILICTIFSGLSIFISVFVINIHHHSPDKPVPGWVKRHIIGKLGRLLCCMNYYNPQDVEPAESKHPTENPKDEKKILPIGKDFSGGLNEVLKYLECFKSMKVDEDVIEDNKDDWNKAARVLDRFILCCYVVFVTCIITTVLALKFNSGS